MEGWEREGAERCIFGTSSSCIGLGEGRTSWSGGDGDRLGCTPEANLGAGRVSYAYELELAVADIDKDVKDSD